MSKHSKEKKQRALALMSAPEKLSVPEVAVRTGVSKATLHLWQREARAPGLAVPAGWCCRGLECARQVWRSGGDGRFVGSGAGRVLPQEGPVHRAGAAVAAGV
jgi:transposase-like protein